jgi:hypothetical protein
MRTISMGYKQNDISRDFMVKNCDDYVYITIEKMISKDNGYTGDSGYIIEKATFKVTIN